MKKLFILFFVAPLLFTTGCVDPNASAFGPATSAVQTRSYQSRAFDTADTKMVLNSVIATLQDMGLTLGRTEAALGTATASKFQGGKTIILTVSVREAANKQQTIVRLNVRAGDAEVTNMVTYQDFFNRLGQSMFLDAHEII